MAIYGLVNRKMQGIELRARSGGVLERGFRLINGSCRHRGTWVKAAQHRPEGGLALTRVRLCLTKDR
jgi:hypothetical protein